MPELATYEREALIHWMRDCTEILSGLLPEVHMPSKRQALAGLLRRMEQHAAVLDDRHAEAHPGPRGVVL